MHLPLGWIRYVSAFILLSAMPLAGQQPAEVRGGFWIAFGLGSGSYGTSCDGCVSVARESGATLHLRVGGTLKPNLLLGGDIIGFNKSQNGTEVTMSSVTLNAYYYPMRKAGLFITGGVGASTLNGSAPNGAIGFGISVGAGFDIPVTRFFSITPLAYYAFGALGDYAATPGLKQSLFDFGLDVTLH